MLESETGTAVAARPEEDDIEFGKHLIAEIETPLDLDAAPDTAEKSRTARRDWVEKLKKREAAPSKADLYELDRIGVEIASAEELIAQAPGLYRKYCQERGEAVDPNDRAMKPPSPDDENGVKALRARMLEILRALHWSYTFGPIREKTRVKRIREVMLVMVVASIIMGVLVGVFRRIEHPFFSIFVTVVYAGVMGGAVSCARRLGNVSTTDDALGSIYVLKNSSYVLFFAPMLGAVFAVVTMLLFMGEVLTGSLFPSFGKLTTAGPVSGPWAFTNALLPASSKEYALLFLWCFIAGFAERLIPDTLDGLTKRATAQKTDSGKTGTATQQ